MEIKKILYNNLKTMTFEDYQKYLDEVENGYIKINKHPEDDNIVILNYTENTTFERHWNEQTMSARGLILDITNAKDNGIIYILAKPFPKFFNLSEMPEYEEDINFNEIESIMEKMDGSLGISYFFKNEIRFATRGNFNSEQAIKATEMFREKYSQYEDFENYSILPVTYLVEIIYPENRIVVNYKDREELVMIGTTLLFSEKFIDTNYEHVQWEANRLHMKVPFIKYATIEDLLKDKNKLSANEEGFVVKFTNGKRLKIKGDQYICVHKLLHGVSDKSKFKAWETGEINQYILSLPEEFRQELEEFSDKLDKLKDSLYILLQTFFEMISEISVDRKSFAFHVNDLIDKEYRKFMFKALNNGSISVEQIRKHISDNYTEYLEVVKLWDNNASL